jgi:hypothetical protein
MAVNFKMEFFMTITKKVAHYLCAKSFLRGGKFVFDLRLLKNRQIVTIFDMCDLETQIRKCGYIFNHTGNFNFEVIK